MRILFISLLTVLLDQASKLLVRFNFEYGKSHEILGDLLRLTYIENPGMAFGIQFGGQMFFTAFASLATVIIFIYIVRARGEKMPLRLALALILGGAVGNLIDRFLYGRVVDFVDVGLGSSRWPIFNFADSAVTVGMIILIAMVIFTRNKGEEDSEVATENEAFS